MPRLIRTVLLLIFGASSVILALSFVDSFGLLQRALYFETCAQAYPTAPVVELMLWGGIGSTLGVSWLWVCDRRRFGAERQTAEQQLERLNQALDHQRTAAALEELNQVLEARVEARTAELREREQFLQTVLDTVPLSVFWKDRDSVYLGGNCNFLRDASLSTAADLVGKTDCDLPWQESEAKAYRAVDRQVLSSGTPVLNMQSPRLRQDGGLKWLETNKLPLRNLDGDIIGILGTYQDITARKQAEIALQQSEARLRLITDSVHACISYIDSSQRYQFVNRTYELWFSRSKASILGCTIEAVIGPEAYRLARPYIERALTGETVIYEAEIPYRGGQTRYVSAVLVPKVDLEGAVHGYYALTHDISDLKHTQQRIAHNALHDPLTGLPNRTLITRRIEQAIARFKGVRGDRYAVLFLDLDRFKVINDSLGHAVGDQLLCAIARRLMTTLGEVGCVARFGGDEFVILLEAVSGIEAVVQLIESILAAVPAPFEIDGHQVSTGISIGAVMSTPAYSQPANLIRDADIAMYKAKAKGGTQYQFFNTTMHTQMLDRLTLETDLRRAIDQQEFMVYYQPVVRLANLQLMGFEALVRWRHPTRQLVSPDEFIPIAEEMGIVGVLDSWTFQTACQQLACWREAFTEANTLRISINLSTQDLRRLSLIDDIDAVLCETGLTADSITLEITESLLIDDIHQTLETLGQITSRGIRISIDDFGTGYSSLSYLHHLPVDYLKIDSSFIERMELDNRQYQVIDTIIALSDRLDLTAVAEGIETAEQLRLLRELGCDLGQGYLFSEAITAREVEMRFLERG